MKVLLLLFAFALGALSSVDVWPKPQFASASGEALSLEVPFAFEVVGQSNALLEDVLKRYKEIIFGGAGDGSSGAAEGSLKELEVNLLKSTTKLDSHTDESYSLDILASSKARLTADNVFGAMRGIETFAQLVEGSSPSGAPFKVPVVQIRDEPRFAFRGFLFDTSRHFLSVRIIKRLIDLLSANKFNVFHWHIVDSEAFPYTSEALPKLSEGAYSPKLVYSRAQVADIIDYAKSRGVRVVAEFDTPGHSESWGVGYPELVTRCFDENEAPSGVGPLNPTLNTTFEFLETLYKEIQTTFPDDYVHIGGDEVSFECWMSNPSIQAWMKERGWSDYALLEQYYERSLIDIVERVTDKSFIVWQEIFDNGLKIQPETIIDVWKGDQEAYEAELAKVTAAGFQAILSAPWYLNYIQNPYTPDAGVEGDWTGDYLVEPENFGASADQKKLLIGGEATMWAEFVDGTNVVSRSWPRGSAVGERLWSAKNVTDVADAEARLSSWRCKMLGRGYQVEPVTGPGHCDKEWL